MEGLLFFLRWSQTVYVRVTYESSEGYQKSPRLLQMLIIFHVQTESSFVVASLSFYSARVSVVSTVVVRVMLD